MLLAAEHHHGVVHVLELMIRRGGCPVLFVVLLGCGLGLPLPEDIPLITAGIMIFHGHMTLWLAAICAWCGIIGGDCILYSLGRKFGPDVARLPIIGRHINVSRMARVEKWFEQYGILVVAVGRMFAGIRGVMVVVAGTSRYRFWKFVVADGAAAIVSGGLFVYLGFKFAEHLDDLHKIVQSIKGWMMVGLIAIVIALTIYVLWRKRSERRRGFPVLQREPQPLENDAPPSASTTENPG